MRAHWRTAPVTGEWRIVVTEYYGHRLSVRRTRAGMYRAHLDGRPIGLWRRKAIAIAAVERAALAPKSRRAPAPSRAKWPDTLKKYVGRERA
jgi:hypothetical protein